MPRLFKMLKFIEYLFCFLEDTTIDNYSVFEYNKTKENGMHISTNRHYFETFDFDGGKVYDF